MIQPYKDLALQRLQKAKGQIEGIMKMIEQGKYCPDILTQVLALHGAVKGTLPLILESHLTTCGKALNSSDTKKKKKFIQELVRVCELSSR